MDRVLLTLGGSSDIGLNYIRNYHQRYDVIVAQYYSHKEELEELQKTIDTKLIFYQLDLADEAEVGRFLEYLEEEKLYPNYILHLPARKTQLSRIGELDITEVELDFDVQVISIIRIINKLVCFMQEQQFGRICFMLSSVTEKAITFNLSYMVSKYALLGAMKAFAVELVGKKIMVNAVSPSMVNTKFIDDVPEFVKKKGISLNPMRRLAEATDVTRAIDFFLSDENEYITGENLLIAGGGIIS